MRGAALAVVLAAAGVALACSHPHPHPQGPPTPTGSATPVEPPLDAGAPAAVVDAAPEAEGGFGFAPDAAPGATANPCGDAVGTIGTGKYGTIGGGCGGYAVGHGSGSGYGVGGGGCGGMRRNAAVPSIKLGTIEVTGGDLDKAIVRRYVKRNMSKFQYCYEKDLLVNPGEQGTVTLTYTIQPDGTVRAPKASGVSDAVSACVRDDAKDIEYPKPKDGKAVDVRLTFTYLPTSS